MKMKMLILTTLLLLSWSCFMSCEKTEPDPKFEPAETEVFFTAELPDGAVLINWEPDDATTEAGIALTCMAPACKRILPDILTYYKALAEETCKPMKIAVRCCSGGFAVYAVAKIIPTPACFHPDPVTPYDRIG